MSQPLETTTESPGDRARRAAEALRRGGLVGFPTETVYGIGVWAMSDAGWAKWDRWARWAPRTPGLKGPAWTGAAAGVAPGVVHVGSVEEGAWYVDATSAVVGRAVRKLLIGPVTLMVEVGEEVRRERLRALGLEGERGERVYRRGTVSLRLPDHAVTREMLRSVKGPVVAMGLVDDRGVAALDGEDAARAVRSRRVGEEGGAAGVTVIDGGRATLGKPSTLVSVRRGPSGWRWSVEREGVYDRRIVDKLMRWSLLIVCSGNTCRSPMAEGLARRMLAEERKLPDEELETAGVRVTSAGAFASGGSPASAEAVAALAKMGIDLSRHRSRRLTAEMVREADVIYCMTRTHVDAVLDLDPSAADKTFMLDPLGRDVEDPVGLDLKAYQRCAEMIRRRLEQRLKEQQA